MTRWARVARGTLAALVSTFIAAFSHAVAGGDLPGTAGLALCFVFSWLVCIALAGRRWPRMRRGAALAAPPPPFRRQLGPPAARGATPPPVAGLPLAHDHGAPLVFAADVGHAHAAGDMWLAHLVAALVTFLALAFGERSVAAIAGAARRFVVSLLPRMPELAVESSVTQVAAVRVRASRPRIRRLEFTALRHRGPPAPRFA